MSTAFLFTTFCMVGSAILFPVATCSDPNKKELIVKIVANYTPPVSFSFKPPSYRAGSSLTLSCEVEGTESDDSGLLYEWRSSCGGNCFVRSGSIKAVSTQYLHSYDKGVHTCVVHDRGGCTGNASITVNVVGAGIYVESPRNEVLPNNSLIVETESYFPRMPHFRGLSGSNQSHTGQLIDPYGTDITSSITDPFLISLGSGFEPGMMRVRSFRSLRENEVGTYTYRTPDESGRTIDVHFGLYTSSASRHPMVTSLDAYIGGKIPFVLTCESQHSPPTEVIWGKDGQLIDLNDNVSDYKMTQVLVNRVTSTYKSTLTKDGVLDDVVGEYSCTVVNSLGTSNTRNTTVNPITITGHETPIIVGLSGRINCSTVLNASKLEWRLVGIGKGEPIENTDQGQSLVMSLSPEATELNGAKLTCRVSTVNNKVFEKTVTVTIKELDNFVRIEGSSNSIIVGTNATFMCIITSDFTPSVQWLDNNNDPVTSSGDTVWTEQQYTIGNHTYMRLKFDPIRSSHGGSYTCKSVISNPASTNSTSKRILIKLAADSVGIEQSPKGHHYTGQSLQLKCWTHLNDSIDTSVQIIHTWTGPSGTITTDSRKQVTRISKTQGAYLSSLTFHSLRTSDSGTYSCLSTIQPYENHVSSFISSSNPKIASIAVNAVIKVYIRITYSSPDPGYSPPNYRAASTVTLTCVASGVSGYASYRWSSTCSSCFASSSSSSSITKSFLVPRDAGVHTCTVTDTAGNRGSNQTTMNVAGTGIYVSLSAGTGIGSSSGTQPNNSYAVVYSNSRYYYSSTRIKLYCCSSSIYNTGGITFPNGGYYTSSSYRFTITRYSSTDSHAGCIYMYANSRYSFRLSYSGTYTCSFGNNQVSSIALYNQGSISQPNVKSLQRLPWSATYSNVLRIAANTRYSPPTNLTWYRNGIPIDTTKGNASMAFSITSRSSSYYTTTLSLADTADKIIGMYNISMEDSRGRVNSGTTTVIRGIQITCNSTRFIVGQPVNCVCSSDLEPTLIEWFKGNQSSSSCLQKVVRYSISHTGSSSLVIIPHTEDHEEVFKCVTTTPYGTQDTSILVQVEVPDNWSAVAIEPSSDIALNSHNHSLVCKLTSLPGLNLPISIQWLFQNETTVTSHGNRSIGSLEAANYTISTSTSSCQIAPSYTRSTTFMTFQPVHNSDGGTYICQASVRVPWMTEQPQRVSGSVHMPVTTQAKFQLKIYPVTHCSTWNVSKARELEVSIKKNLEEAVSSLCNCPFQSIAFYSGKFNCQPQTCESDEKCGPSSSAVGPVMYRAIVNGTSDLLTADQILDYIDSWREDTGTLLHNDVFQLGVYSKKKCALKIDSFNKKGC